MDTWMQDVRCHDVAEIKAAKTIIYYGGITPATFLERWSEEMQVSMMADGAAAAPPPPPPPHIKEEPALESGLQPACSPSDAALYSPSTTVLHSEMDFCEGGGGGDARDFGEAAGAPPPTPAQARSPASPERQFCSSTTQPMGHADEGIKEEDMPRRLCLVCGDVASGFHYGVASCEACKAFFKRTIQGNIEYTCPAANDCEINKRRRKACQACRFQKCLRMGMLKEGVRLDRVRGGRQKYRRNPDLPYQVQAFMPRPVLSLDENKMLKALTSCEPDLLLASPDTSIVDLELRVVSTLSDLYDRELVGVISWAKLIPGFTELTLNDQMRLLQSTWAEILTLALAFRSLGQGGKLRFAADFSIDEKVARDCSVLEVYQHCMHIVERLERLAIAEEEYYVLKALVLANSDVRMDDLAALKKFRDTILAALSDCVAVVRSSSASHHMQQLLLCLPALRQADQVIRRYWTAVHREGKAPMNKLFVEMLEANFR